MRSFLYMGGVVMKTVKRVEQASAAERTWECVCHGTIHHSPVVGEEAVEGRTLGVCDRCEALYEVQEYEAGITHLKECPFIACDIEEMELRYSVADYLNCPHCDIGVRVFLFEDDKNNFIGALKDCKCNSCGEELSITWSDEGFAVE